MDRKFANIPGWKRILQNRFYSSYLDSPEFKGYITLYCMDAVREPLVVEYFGRPTCIADVGYAWLKQFPTNGHFTVTAQYNSSAQIVAWYIDICLRTGVDQDQVPWMDDLYLDLIVSPAMDIEVKDAEELLAARKTGEISDSEFDLAWREANQLMKRIIKNQFELLALSDVHRQMLLNH
jgi:uncharacterized protein